MSGFYTLDQLAYVNRCLTPDDLARDLRVYTGWNDTEVVSWRIAFRCLAKQGKLNIVQIYQEFIDDEEFTSALDDYVHGFLNP